jgi:hypothetical protein
MRGFPVFVLGVLVAVPFGWAQAQEPHPLPAHQAAALQWMLAEGLIVSPAQAAGAVQTLWGEATPTPRIEAFSVSENPRGRGSPWYAVRIDEGRPFEGRYDIRAQDGVLMGFSRPGTPGTNVGADGNLLPPTVPVAQGRATAEAFATQMIPTFPQRRWRLTKAEDVGYYGYSWQELVGPLDAVAPWDLRVCVDWFNGEVFSYGRPTEELRCPVVPDVTLTAAKALAGPHAWLDPVAFPFVGELQIHESEFGVQFLVWELRQYPDPQDQPNTFFAVGVNGLTGEVYPPIGPLGGAPPEPGGHRPRPVPAPPGPLLLVPGRELPIRGADGPLRREGRLWLRAEALRALGADVWLMRDRLVARQGQRRLTLAKLGAVRRQYGWEVPLRQAAAVLGWEVRWDGKKQQAEAVRPPAQRGAAKPEPPGDPLARHLVPANEWRQPAPHHQSHDRSSCGPTPGQSVFEATPLAGARTSPGRSRPPRLRTETTARDAGWSCSPAPGTASSSLTWATPAE